MSSAINLQQIGKSLAQIRTQKNLSLEMVANQTAIAKRVLQAIEQGDSHKLPEPFYTKALLKKYAQALEATEILATLSETQSAIALDSQLQDSQAQVPEKIQTSVKLAKSPQIRPITTWQLRSSHLYCLYILLVAIAVKTIASVVEQPVVITDPAPIESELIRKTSNSSTSNPAETPTTISSASPSQFVSQSNSNNAESVVVDILLKDLCWLKVMVDGQVAFEGTLAKGTQRSWTGQDQINIIAGNAGGVVVTYNHGKEKLLGKPGEVEEVIYRRVN